MRRIVGALTGFIIGSVLGITGFYVLFMAPRGTEFRYIDQGTLIIWITGPLGAVVGAMMAGMKRQ